MSFRLNCQCGTSFTASPDQRGQKVACPGCGKVRRLPSEKPKQAASKAPSLKQVEDPIAAWKSKRKSLGKTPALWFVGGVAVLGLILGVFYFVKNSPDAKTVSQNLEPPAKESPATANPSNSVPIRENKPQIRSDSQPQVVKRTPPAPNQPEVLKPPPIKTQPAAQVNEKPTPKAVAAVTPAPAKPSSTPVSDPREKVNRNRQEVLALITRRGRWPQPIKRQETALLFG